jgi:hypothetical protein
MKEKKHKFDTYERDQIVWYLDDSLKVLPIRFQGKHPINKYMFSVGFTSINEIEIGELEGEFVFESMEKAYHKHFEMSKEMFRESRHHYLEAFWYGDMEYKDKEKNCIQRILLYRMCVRYLGLGMKLKLVKYVKSWTGMGLKDSKEYVDGIHMELKKKYGYEDNRQT